VAKSNRCEALGAKVDLEAPAFARRADGPVASGGLDIGEGLLPRAAVTSAANDKRNQHK
jgi:hypothetical protein